MLGIYKSNPAILNEARDYLDGLVLSDGNINCKTNKTGYYRQGCKYKVWLDLISRDLYEYGVECMVDNEKLRTHKKFSVIGGSIECNLWTRSYIEFKEMHDRWYQKDYNIDEYPTTRWHLDEESEEYYILQKIVPNDINLSPECVANWYLGDGHLHKYKYCNGYQIILATNGFLRDDTIFLSELLFENFSIKCSVDTAGRIGIYNKFGVSTFLNYIKDYKVDCYSKKFLEGAM